MMYFQDLANVLVCTKIKYVSPRCDLESDGSGRCSGPGTNIGLKQEKLGQELRSYGPFLNNAFKLLYMDRYVFLFITKQDFKFEQNLFWDSGDIGFARYTSLCMHTCKMSPPWILVCLFGCH